MAEYELKEDDNKLHLDAIVELASKFFDVPIVLVSIVEQSRQFFSARKGLEVCETGRDVSFCAHALELDDILIVPDAKLDSRFARHPLVLGEPFIRFYAGMPLVAPNGHTLGTLCIIDRRPRNGVSAQDREHLKAMAALVLDNLEVRRLAIAYRAGQTRSEQIAATRPMASSAPTTRAGSLFATPPASDCSDPKPLMAEQALVGLEALLRWRHPTEGLLPPIRFVAAIESGAFAAEVGQWLMATACTYAVELHKVLSDLIMGVNLFGAQFQNGQVATNVMEVLQQTQLPPEALEIEITENIILAHDARVLEPLRTLQELGVDIAFDDFGTGYASLSLLKRYPLTRDLAPVFQDMGYSQYGACST